MGRFKQTERTSLIVSLFLVVVFVLFIHVNFVKAEEIEAINPNLGFDYYLLLEGQSVTSNTIQILPFDFITVGILSMGNVTLSASLSIAETEASGLWWVSIIGTGGTFWYDFTFGLVPVSGSTAIVDVDKGVSFALATGGIIVTSPIFAEEPVEYSLTVRGSI